MRIGVLALQGDFAEHVSMVQQIGVEAIEVRHSSQLGTINGLIIPGGESTTIGKLATDFGMMDDLRAFGRENPIWGTCAGAIFISKDVRRTQPLLGLMDIQVVRNAFGRQVDSFEVDLDISALNGIKDKDSSFHAIFIRAPLIESVQGAAQSLATLPDGQIVAAQEGHWLATSFHPELTGDDRFHRYFIALCGKL
jgi:5'-phosphate synthase pdxT subunit